MYFIEGENFRSSLGVCQDAANKFYPFWVTKICLLCLYDLTSEASSHDSELIATLKMLAAWSRGMGESRSHAVATNGLCLQACPCNRNFVQRLLLTSRVLIHLTTKLSLI